MSDPALESKDINQESLALDLVTIATTVTLRQQLDRDHAIILQHQDVMKTFQTLKSNSISVTTTMLDPWYNKGVGGKRENYIEWLVAVVKEAADLSQHVFVWGFPEIIYKVLDYLPKGLELVAWLTWYYKNCPSVIRGWRSAQLTCLHLSRKSAILYPEHFLNDAQMEKQRQGKLRYMPGPPSVIEVPLLIGWVGKTEQVGNPSKNAQKPMKVIEPLIKMTTKENDTVLDPMCGTGTTGAVCKMLGRKVILCDHDEQKVRMTEQRLNLKRLVF